LIAGNFMVPAARARVRDLPSADEIRAHFAATGFMAMHHEIIREIVAPDWLALFGSRHCAPTPSWRVFLIRNSIREWLRFALTAPIAIRMKQ
jgi:hypothetical protein